MDRFDEKARLMIDINACDCPEGRGVPSQSECITCLADALRSVHEMAWKRGQENMRSRATQRAQAQREFVRGERGDFYPGDIAGLPILDPEAA